MKRCWRFWIFGGCRFGPWQWTESHFPRRRSNDYKTICHDGHCAWRGMFPVQSRECGRCESLQFRRMPTE